MRSAVRKIKGELALDIGQTTLALGVAILAAASVLLQIGGRDPSRSAVAVGTLVLASSMVIRSTITLRELTLARDERDLLAQTDHVTHLLNRFGFEQVVRRMILSSVALGRPAALLICDIDDFKEVGDRYGHDFADEALLRVADALWAESAQQTVIARRGRQEFVVLLMNASRADALAYAGKLRRAVSAQAIEWAGAQATVTISIGVASTPCFDGPVSKLISHAREALAKTMGEGRNRIAVAGEPA